MGRARSFLFILSLVSLHAQSGYAAGEKSGGGYFGLFGGLAGLNDTSPVFAYGANGLYKFISSLGAGVYYQSFGLQALLKTSDSSQVTVTQSTQYYGLEATLAGSGNLNGFLLGPRFGFGHYSTIVAASSTNGNSSFAESSWFPFVGPHLGFDYHFWKMSGGADVSYLWGSGAGTPDVMLFNLALKYWF